MALYKMTVFIFLLLFFIKLCFCSPFSEDSKSLNYKGEHDFAGNTSTTARVKRYTRWSGGTIQASAEFLVQIFDDVLPASSSSLAPDVFRFEERLGKLRLGSVKMPSRTTLTTQAVSEPPEYTRFMPRKDNMIRVGDLTLDENHSVKNQMIDYTPAAPTTPKKFMHPRTETALINEDGKINKVLAMIADDKAFDQDAAIIERAIQYTAVPVSSREQHQKVTKHVEPARIPNVKSIILAPLLSTKFFPGKRPTPTDSFAFKQQTYFNHTRTSLYQPKHSTRLNPESDDNSINNSEGIDYDDTDKGGNDPDKEPGDYDESNDDDVYEDKTTNTRPVPNDGSSSHSSTVLNWEEDEEIEERSTTHTIKPDKGQSTSSIRTSTKIYWSAYDDYSDEESTKKKLTSTNSPRSTKKQTESTLIKRTTGDSPTVSHDHTQTKAESHLNDTKDTVNNVDDTKTIKDSKLHHGIESEDDSSDYGEIDGQHIATSSKGTNTDHTSKATKTSTIPTTSFTHPSVTYLMPHDDCNISEEKPFTFVSHHKLTEIMSQLEKWGASPVAKMVDISKGNRTYMLNSIQMIVVDDRSHGQDSMAKQTVLIVAGLQGRDHYAVSAAMYFLFELIERSKHHMDLLSQYRFWIIPVFNPDGYDYSTSFQNVRDWKKNLRQSWEKRESCQKHGIHCVLADCMGVHLDRNFEYQWISGVETHPVHPCSELYPGERQLSEPETAALARHLHGADDAVLTFVALKEGDVRGVLYPYSHTKNNRASDSVHRMRAAHAATAAKSIAGRNYVHGQASEFLPLYAGGIEDWMEGHHGVDNSYTIMLDQPEENATIETLSQEVFAAVDTILLTKSPPLMLTFNAPQDSAGEARHTLGWRWLRRRGALPTMALLTQPSVVCLYFVCFYVVASILRVIDSTP